MYIYPRMIFLISHSDVVFFLFEVNKCPSEQDAYFAIGFLYSFLDQDRMKRLQNTRMFNFNFDLCL